MTYLVREKEWKPMEDDIWEVMLLEIKAIKEKHPEYPDYVKKVGEVFRKYYDAM